MLKGQDDLKDQKWKHGNPADNPDPPRVRVRAKSPRPAMNASLRKKPKSEASEAPEPKSILKSKKPKPEECAEPPAKKKKREEVDVQNEEQGKDLSKKEAKKDKKDIKDKKEKKKTNKEEGDKGREDAPPLRKKKPVDDLQVILNQFEDSGPEIDEEDFELELRKWQEERATVQQQGGKSNMGQQRGMNRSKPWSTLVLLRRKLSLLTRPRRIPSLWSPCSALSLSNPSPLRNPG